MEIKFDFCITPGSYNGTGPAPRDQHVKGSAEIPDAPLLAVLAALMSDTVAFEGIALERAVKLLKNSERMTTDG